MEGLNLALVSEIRHTDPTPAALSGAEQQEVDRVTVKVRRLRTVTDELRDLAWSRERELEAGAYTRPRFSST